MSKRVIFFNNTFLPESEAKLSIYDSALMFGDMVFEMTRSFNQKQFKLKEHLDRLFRGIKIYQIPIKISLDELTEICHETVKVNQPFFNNSSPTKIDPPAAPRTVLCERDTNLISKMLSFL